MQNNFSHMYDKYFSGLPDKAEYLKRIGLDRTDIFPNRECLDRLQFAHLCTVPFENIDIFDYKIKIDFGIEELFEKIVMRRRGGYCFELNAIYMALLEAIGFETYPIGVRIFLGINGYIPAIAHRALIVKIDGKRYYSDVGFGVYYAPAFSINIDDYSEQKIHGEVFKVEDRLYNNKMIMRKTENGMSELFMFNLDPFNILDFIAYNTILQNNYGKKRVVLMRTYNGSISIDGKILRRRENGNISETPLNNTEDIFEVLQKIFGMILTAPFSSAG